MTRNVAALRFSKIAVFDSLEALGLRSQDWVLGFVNVAVDHRGKERILFVFKSARTVKLSLALVDSGIGSLFAIECLGLAVNDRPPFLMTIWAMKVFEPSFRVRPIIVPSSLSV